MYLISNWLLGHQNGYLLRPELEPRRRSIAETCPDTLPRRGVRYEQLARTVPGYSCHLHNDAAAATRQGSSVCPRRLSSQMPLNVNANDPIERLVNREPVLVLAGAQATVPAPTRGLQLAKSQPRIENNPS